MTIDEFLVACARFARLHPEAVLAMREPELAVDPRARSRHLRSTCERARKRMHTTAQLALKGPAHPGPDWPAPDLFAGTHPTTEQRLTA